MPKTVPLLPHLLHSAISEPFVQSAHEFELVESKLEAGYNLSLWKITQLISVLDTSGQCQEWWLLSPI